ncbi:MAG: ROK family glucokinase [Eubacteriales bacterium]|nr:ROK family glucokinase [Eubacteriales bacterium]
MGKYAFGADIGGTTVKLGLFQTDGTLVAKWEIPTRTEENGGWILEDVARSIQERMKTDKIAPRETEGIGIGVPGPVGEDGIVYKCVNLGWDVTDAAARMRELTGMKISVGNDANVAALGEMWQGGGRGYRNVVMLTLGTGVGGGIILDGHILSGTHGAGGEIGHFPVCEEESEACGCGNKGCLEQYASANGIVRVARRWLAGREDASRLRDLETITAKAIFDLAREKDPLAEELADYMGRMVGRACAYISCVCDPQVFVIGGGVSRAGDILTDSIQKHYAKAAFHACRDAAFKLALLGNDAGIYGCARMVLNGAE